MILHISDKTGSNFKISASVLHHVQRRIYDPVKFLWRNIFVKIVNSKKPLTILAKCFVIGVWQGPKYASQVLQKSQRANIYVLKVNNIIARKRCKICSKVTIKTPVRRHWRRPGVFIVYFEHILHVFLVFLLLTLNR